MFRILVSIITNKNHQHTEYAEEYHSHYDYSQDGHEHDYADEYHSHSRYADKDEFEMLQNKIRTLERFFNSHQYNSNTHQLMLRKVFALFFLKPVP